MLYLVIPTGGAGPSGASSNPSTPNPTTNPPPPASNSPAPQQFPEASIKRLTDMGFGRDQAMQELQLQNGDVDKAAAALFAKSLKLPGQ